MSREPLAAVAAVLFTLVSSMIGLPAAQAQEELPPPKPLLRVDVTSVSPRVVSADDETITVTARVKNISDVPVQNLKSRLQIGTRQTTSTELRQALRGTAPQDAQLTSFEDFSPLLKPGEATDLTLVADLGGVEGGLSFAEAGVYPLLVNVNGTPRNAGEARLAAVNMVLPVRDLPGGEPAQRPASPQPLSILWPIAARPRVVSDPVEGSIVLADETLTDEMRPGGRLHALVGAAAQAKADGRIFDGICFAVDPELLSTARSMADGYRVRTGLSVRRGAGSDVAGAWLRSLRELVDGECLVPTPYAGADVSALASRSPALATAAANRNNLLRDGLGTEPLPGAIWSTGALTGRAAQAFADARKDLVISSAEDFDEEQPAAVPSMVASGDGGANELRALPYDALGALSLAPETASPELVYPATVAADDPTIAAQNAVATVLFRAIDEPGGGPLLLAPPRGWDATADELQWMLRELADLSDEDVVQPAGLPSLIEDGSGETVRPAAGSTAGLPSRVTGQIAELNEAVGDLSEAMDESPTQQIDPGVIVDPLRNALLRTASVDFHGVRGGRTRALRDAEAQLVAVQKGVRISDPGRTIALASGSSPIPVSIANRLPVEVTVQVRLSGNSGLRTSEVAAIQVPAGRSRNLKVPAEALRAGRFTVDVQLTTPGGTDLGEPARFELTSTQYGAITVIVTATAAGALLLLAGRRIYRRLRANGAARGPDEDPATQ